MDSYKSGPQFGSDIYVIDIGPDAIFKWVLYVVEKLIKQFGPIEVEWNDQFEASDLYGIIELWRKTPGGHWRELNIKINVLPLKDEKSLIELIGVDNTDHAEMLDWLLREVEATWPGVQKDRNLNRRRHEDKYTPNIPREDLAGTGPTPIKMLKDYGAMKDAAKLYNRNPKATGGHPSLACNDWAYEELRRRPRDRESIYRQWVVLYTEEVGQEVAELRDLREAFNSAMRHRKKKDQSA